MKALANEEVGDYVNRNFVATYMKIGTFRVANGQKQGGNVAAYICTPGGKVLHAIAGPVDAQTLLKEVRWAIDTWKLALLDGGNTLARLPGYYKKFHYDRLRLDHGFDNRSARLPAQFQSPQHLAMYFGRTRLGNQGKVHLLLTAYPLVDLKHIYPVVFENILGETVSAAPVLDADAGGGGNRGIALAHGFGPAQRMPTGLGIVDRPRVEEERELRRQEQVLRARQSPPLTEVWSGQSLNDLLIDLQLLRERGVQPEDQPLDGNLLNQVSVVSGRAGGSIGLLRANSLTWPGLLRHERHDAERLQVEELLGSAVAQASQGGVDPRLLDDISRALLLWHERLRQAGGDGPLEYMEAKRYLRQLQDAVASLRRPDAARLMAGEYAARGQSVAELVEHMTTAGLRFAPALPGQEPAYAALHRALAAYNLRAHGAAVR